MLNTRIVLKVMPIMTFFANITILLDMHILREIIVLLRHLCRFEKGGHCKEIDDSCEAQKCPQFLIRR